MKTLKNFLPADFRILTGTMRDSALSAAHEKFTAFKEARKAELAAEKAERLHDAKTCQVCGRGILANTGLIAHHGYQRPGDGWQTRSCSGAKELPFEVSRDALATEIAYAKERAANLASAIVDVQTEQVELTITYTVPRHDPRWNNSGYPLVHRGVTRENWEALKEGNPAAYKAVQGKPETEGSWVRLDPTFDDLMEATLDSIQQRLDHTNSYIKMQTARFDGWTQTHERVNDRWISLDQRKSA